jgi:hypothetical protein
MRCLCLLTCRVVIYVVLYFHYSLVIVCSPVVDLFNIVIMLVTEIVLLTTLRTLYTAHNRLHTMKISCCSSSSVHVT